jgi:hypothetical protein
MRAPGPQHALLAIGRSQRVIGTNNTTRSADIRRSQPAIVGRAHIGIIAVGRATHQWFAAAKDTKRPLGASAKSRQCYRLRRRLNELILMYQFRLEVRLEIALGIETLNE